LYAVAASSHRWKHLVINRGLFQYEILRGVKSRLPCLNELVLDESGPSDSEMSPMDVFEAAPQPHNVRLFVNPSTVSLPWPQTRYLHMTCTILDCLEILTQSSNLSKCSLNMVNGVDSFSPYHNNHTQLSFSVYSHFKDFQFSP